LGDIRRREFVTLLGGATVWPSAGRAQNVRVPVIGFLGPTTHSIMSKWVTAFVERLRDLGWVEGRNIEIEYRWAEGRSERFADIAAEFVRIKVDVIVAQGTAAVAAAKQTTSVIPIIFPSAGDPVGTGLVASLARPGGNVTGVSIQQPDVAGKRLELLREVVPGLRRLAILANIGSDAAVLEMREVQAAARTLGLEVSTLEIRRADDIATAIQALKERAEALDVVTDPLLTANRVRINTFALVARLPPWPSIERREGKIKEKWGMLTDYDRYQRQARAVCCPSRVIRWAT
jgi:putative tryptophan/tyrosine transport system substrate-binding protein